MRHWERGFVFSEFGNRFSILTGSGVSNYKMATKNDDAELEEVCQCSVCLERYSDPRMLPCHHCFCKECLEDLLNVRPQGGKISFNRDVQIVCPNCRDICKFEDEKNLSSLPRNLHLSQVVDLLHKRSSKKHEDVNENGILGECSFCGVKPSNIRSSFETGFFKCTACRKFYCGSCFKQKHMTKNDCALKQHVMILKRTKDGEFCLCCESHRFVLKYFCNDCQKVSCVDCCLSFHRHHEIRTLDFAAYVIRENLKPDMEKARRNIDLIGNLKSSYGSILSSVEDTKQDAVQLKIQQRKEAILKHVSKILDRAQEDLICTWNENRTLLISGLNKKIEELEIMEASGRSMLDTFAQDRMKCSMSIVTELEVDSFREELHKIVAPTAQPFSTESLDYCLTKINLGPESCGDLKSALGHIRSEQEKIDKGNNSIPASNKPITG